MQAFVVFCAIGLVFFVSCSPSENKKVSHRSSFRQKAIDEILAPREKKVKRSLLPAEIQTLGKEYIERPTLGEKTENLGFHLMMLAGADSTLYPPLCKLHEAAIAPDDYEVKAICIWSDSSVPMTDTIRQLESLIQEVSIKAPDVESYLLNLLASKLIEVGDIFQAIDLLERSLKQAPKWAYDVSSTAKERLAWVYTLTSNRTLALKGMKLYLEIFDQSIATCESSPTKCSLEYMESLTYNIGFAYFLALKDSVHAKIFLEKAAEFSKRRAPDQPVAADIQLFRAFIAASEGDKKGFESLTRDIDVKNSEVWQSCYFELSRSLVKLPFNLNHCLDVAPSVDFDIKLDIVKRLLPMSLTQEQEIKNLRNFVAVYQDKIEPLVMAHVEKIATRSELAAAQAELRFQSHAIENAMRINRLNSGLMVLVGLLVVCFAFAFASYRLAIRRGKALEEQKKWITFQKDSLEAVLHAIQDGLIMIQSNLCLGSDISDHAASILGVTQTLEGSTLKEAVLRLSSLSSDEQQMILSSLEACFGEDSMTWQLNVAHFPLRTTIAGREIDLFWQPLFFEEKLKEVLLALTDRTEQVAWEKLAHERDLQTGQLAQFIHDIVSVNRSLVATVIGEANLEISSWDDQELVGKLGFLHSLKGNARLLNLNGLKTLLHDMEEDIQKTGTSQKLPMLRSAVIGYQEALGVLQGPATGASASDFLGFIASFKMQLDDQLRHAGLRMDSLSVIEEANLTATERPLVRNILVHGLSNAVDHGYIRPLKEGMPKPGVRLLVQLHQAEGYKTLTVADEGAGIDWSALKQRAKERMWQPGPGRPLTDLLFEGGISTAEQTTESSGRGIGLQAIREFAETLQGEVQLLDRESGRGTALKVRWPAQGES